MTTGRRGPAWLRLIAHSHRLGARWLVRGLRGRGWTDVRGGVYRMLVPLEPWRFHELARVAREPVSGDCLDVSSPKLLPSLLAHEGAGSWVAIDILPDEIARWRVLDPALDLRVADARALPFADASFDTVVCVSVIEHVAGDGDATAMAEIWRVLRPGGVLHLTTNVTARPTEVRTARPVYGDADPHPPATVPGEGVVTDGPPDGAFFERRYDDAGLTRRLLGLPWTEEAREYVRERLPVHRLFFAARPLSFLVGNLLALVCPVNFRRIRGSADVPEGTHGVVYLRLRRPA